MMSDEAPPPSRFRAVRTALAPLGRALGRLPRPSRRTAFLGLALIVAGAVILPRVLDRIPSRYPVQAPRGQDVQARQSLHGFRAEIGATEYLVSTPAPAADPPAAPWGRRIIRRAVLEVELADIDRAVARLAEMIEAFGGYVADTHSETDDKGTARATITAYVPPDRLGRALAGLEGLGHITSRRISGQDVSEEFVDLEARLRNLERHEAQLLSFMGKAQKVADLLSLENELARVRGEIERLAGRLAFLKARTEMASMQVALVRAPFVHPPDGALVRLWEEVRTALREAWFGAFRAAAFVLVLAAHLSPLVPPTLLGWALYRRWARRRPTAATGLPQAG